MMKTMMQKIEGKKTYILSIALVVYAILGMVLGKMSPKEAMDLLFGAGFAATIRNAIA